MLVTVIFDPLNLIAFTYIHKGNLYTANNTEIRVTMRLTMPLYHAAMPRLPTSVPLSVSLSYLENYARQTHRLIAMEPY